MLLSVSRMHLHLLPYANIVEVEALSYAWLCCPYNHRYHWPHPTSHQAFSRTSLCAYTGIYEDCVPRPDEISLVSPSTFTTFHLLLHRWILRGCHSRFFASSMAFDSLRAARLPLASFTEKLTMLIKVHPFRDYGLLF